MAGSWHVGGFRLLIPRDGEDHSKLGEPLRPVVAAALVDRLFPAGLAIESTSATLTNIGRALGLVFGDAGSPDERALKKALTNAFLRADLVALKLKTPAPAAAAGHADKAAVVPPPPPPAPVKIDILHIVAVPPNFAPSAETCKIDFELTRKTGRVGKKVKLTIKDKDGTTVFTTSTPELDGGDKGTFSWDGKGSGGKFVGPQQSPFAIKAEMVYDATVEDDSTVKVEVKEIALAVTAPDDKLMMNDPDLKVETIATVKIKKTDGTGVLTQVPVDVTFTFTDPAGDNTTKATSFVYQAPKALGKKDDAAAVLFAAHPDSSSSSADGYKTQAKATTIVATGADLGKAKIYFKPSGVGGDDFKLKAAVLDGVKELAAAESNTLTVWRSVTFDKIYEMNGETHISVNGATAIISPVFVPAFVKYEAGAPIAIDAAKSVKYIGLWTSAAAPQQSWAAVQAKLPAETPTAAEIADAGYVGADAALVAKRVAARAAIIAKAQAWVDRIDTAFSTSMDQWVTDSGIPENALVAIKFYHPKYSNDGADFQTNEWKLGGRATPAWLRVGAYSNGTGGYYYTPLDPDALWINWGGLSHGSGRVTAPKGNSASTVKQVVRHEAGHATSSFFKREDFGPSLDHSASQAGIMYETTDGGTTFTNREKKILRGILP